MSTKMTENQLVSMIVPIYKVEKYLGQCIESLLAQTYHNLQIILVDDGSPDRSGEICEEYAKKDDRILVIHKENGGLSDARNAGIEKAEGEWFCFIDSDDFIAPDMVERLYRLATEHRAKLAWCGLKEVEEDAEYSLEVDRDSGAEEEITVYTPVEAEKQFFTMNKQKCLVTWNKLYHRSLYASIRFPKGKLYEDGYTTYRAIYIAEKVVTTSRSLYYYRQRKGSIMADHSDRIYLPSLEAGKERLDFYRQNGETELVRLEVNLALYTSIHFYQVIRKKEIQREIKGWFKMFYEEYFKQETWPLAKRLRMRSFLIGAPCYRFISGFENIYNRLRKKRENV